MQIRRCSALLIEPRESVAFDLDSLLAGGNGLSANIELLALAPHLLSEVAISTVEADALSIIGATSWTPFDALAEKFDAALLHALLQKGLLISDDERHAENRERDEKLRAANWHPHSAVSHYFGRWKGVTSGESTDRAGYKSSAELAERLGASPPHVHARVPAEQRITLPETANTSMDELLAQRVTCRNFDTTRQLPLATFSRLLWRVFGAQAAVEMVKDHILIKRTSPSGGGLHPTEAYLLVQRVEGITPGLYHYHPIDHALEPLDAPDGDLHALANTFVAAQNYYADAHVQVVLVSRFERTFWKYRNHSKAYRVCLLDAGHLSQTLYISATEFGLGAFITAAMNEVDVEQALGLDPLLESPVAICGFGIRSSEFATIEFDPQQAIWSAEQSATVGIPAATTQNSNSQLSKESDS
ncbi:putative peptide maturation dehydrogenase [Pseudolysobacter antarcticus]|uniref:Putative peptide maturation dehydrogenase n=1 Tax=Pseudolysobacter antarcticus TaxID=2511995 RepID=A0A411HEU9_9GAMM|nr:putative peptide maturation dehydrogenase [Pseudolysobacter antarcticus]QBB69008.1 putative peptide maturation dehydrogenase [Pseudolysobacter antarcticus]